MKAVILAGGLGTRLSEETHLKPKPMVDIGGLPIIYHIMNYIASFGIKNFIICCGYKGYVIKEYFLNFYAHNSNLSINLSDGSFETLDKNSFDWNVTLIDTGLNSMTGGRLARIEKYLDNENFIFTYGDGLSDVDITKLIKFHDDHGKIATVTSVSPPGRFGSLEMGAENTVKSFVEKPTGDGGRINGGYFILKPSVFKYLEGDNTIWEQEPLRRLAKEKELKAFEHNGNWQAMDTLRDKENLERMWQTGKAFWLKS